MKKMAIFYGVTLFSLSGTAFSLPCEFREFAGTTWSTGLLQEEDGNYLCPMTGSYSSNLIFNKKIVTSKTKFGIAELQSEGSQRFRWRGPPRPKSESVKEQKENCEEPVVWQKTSSFTAVLDGDGKVYVNKEIIDSSYPSEVGSVVSFRCEVNSKKDTLIFKEMFGGHGQLILYKK
ncbi:hypothetical protein ACVWXR_005351 [Pseudomonas lurida]